MISIKNLYLSFIKEYDALHNISLEIEDGEKVALIGGADSGKTMLLRVLAKLEKYKKGEVYIKNINLKKIDYRQDIEVGFVPKSFVFLNNKTVKENLEWILKKRNYDSSTINLKVLIAMKSFDIESIQNMKIKQLTNYQKCLVQLARVSLRKVELFLIDDICKDLDNIERQKIIEKIKNLIEQNSQRTFVIAFTDEKLADSLNLKKIYLKDGEIVENENN